MRKSACIRACSAGGGAERSGSKAWRMEADSKETRIRHPLHKWVKLDVMYENRFYLWRVIYHAWMGMKQWRIRQILQILKVTLRVKSRRAR